MGRFDGILLCTDLDGTLYADDKSISDENREAIAYFKEQGGRFTFVTGRMPFFMGDVCAAVQPNAPFGCINGAGLYDHEAGTYLWKAPIHPQVTTLIRAVEQAFPAVGIQINTHEQAFFCRDNIIMQHFRKLTGLPHLTCDYAAPPDPIAKVVFGVAAEEEVNGVQRLLEQHPLAEQVGLIRSEQYLFEILPKESGKGTSIRKLVELLGLDPAKTVAVGDYHNDISMFREAQVAVAVANACPEAKAAANYHTVDNNHHAIARIIADIEDGKLPL